MRRVQLLVNGITAHVDYDEALRSLKQFDNWISAYPLTSGRYSGKLIPFKRNLAPIVLDDCRILTLMPYVNDYRVDLSKKIVKEFIFSALVSLSSSEHEALEFALLNGTWLHDTSIVKDIYWTAPAQAGEFDEIIPPEARSL